MALRTIYPCYFDASLTRKEGRRVAKTEAIQQPNVTRVARAAKSAGFAVEEEPAASHPARWFSREGRIRIEYNGSKEELLKKIAANL